MVVELRRVSILGALGPESDNLSCADHGEVLWASWATSDSCIIVGFEGNLSTIGTRRVKEVCMRNACVHYPLFMSNQALGTTL